MTTAEAIAFAALIVLALGISGLSLWQRRMWLFLGAGLAWVSMGGYLFASYARGEPLWAIAWLGIGFGFLFFMAPLWLREDKEPTETSTMYEEFFKEYDEFSEPVKKARARKRRSKGYSWRE